MQTVPLARTFKLRLHADGFEKVLIAMLDRPPEVQALYSDDDAPRTSPAIHSIGEHHFPNGVRLRLALSTLVNDLFARDTLMPLSPQSSNSPAFQTHLAQKLRKCRRPSHSKVPFRFHPRVSVTPIPTASRPSGHNSEFSASADRNFGLSSTSLCLAP